MLITLTEIETILCKIRYLLIISVLLILGIGITGCSKNQIRVPAISQIETGQHQVGKFVWYDLYTDDLKATSNFYSQLFGWVFQVTESGDLNIKTIFRNDVPIANAIYTTPLKKNIKESRWLGYISVDDVDTISQKVKANKGSVYLPPKELPDRGRIAVIIDPEGAIFGIVKATTGDPKDLGIRGNDWMGSELWTTDIDSAVGFYNLIADYETERVDMGTNSEYTFLVKENKPRAGIVKITWDHIKPAWLPYIAVADVVSVTEKVRQLGGEILVKPDTSSLDGRVAIIADPSGAIFGIQQLPNKESGEEQ